MRFRSPAALCALAAALLAGCAGPVTPGGSASPSGTSSSALSPVPSPSTSTPATAAAVGVYFLTDTGTDLKLVREFREVSGDPLAGAVRTMIAGPQDPDYSTTWNKATQVRSATVAGNLITVDLSAEARTANVGSPGAALMIQQLVYTATSAVQRNIPVQLLIEGKPAGELWGAVSWDKPVKRADPLEVRLLVQINFPSEGASVASPVKVSGEAAVFEATLPWRVLDAAGAVVTQGTAMTAEGQKFAPFAFTVTLAPGRYVIEIREDDPSGGEGGPVHRDTRTVEVR